ncbi:hypothetical protein B0H11DRAFT_2242046 [Mycena galericulata]|nr:hypothetical protein B0H11DRAFT_2242046 [Mycena galericulata]
MLGASAMRTRRRKREDVILSAETELDQLLIQTVEAGKHDSKKNLQLFGPVYFDTNPVLAGICGVCKNPGKHTASGGSAVFFGDNSNLNQAVRVWGTPTNATGNGTNARLIAPGGHPRDAMATIEDEGRQERMLGVLLINPVFGREPRLRAETGAHAGHARLLGMRACGAVVAGGTGTGGSYNRGTPAVDGGAALHARAWDERGEDGLLLCFLFPRSTRFRFLLSPSLSPRPSSSVLVALTSLDTPLRPSGGREALPPSLASRARAASSSLKFSPLTRLQGRW